MKKKVNYVALVSQMSAADIIVGNQDRYQKIVEEHTVDGIPPMEVVFSLPAGYGDKGYGDYYSPKCIQGIVDQINDPENHIIPGFLGHTRPEDLSYVLRDIVAVWVAAIWNEAEATAYVRAVVSKHNPELASHLKTGVIDQISLSGALVSYDDMFPEDYWDERLNIWGLNLKSLDFTPPGMAGMETRLIATQMNKEAKGTMDAKEFAKKMKAEGISLQELAQEMGETTKDSSTLVSQMSGKLGRIFENEESALEYVSQMKAEVDKANAANRTALISQMVNEKVQPDNLRKLVCEMTTARMGMVEEFDKTKVEEVITEVLKVDYVDAMVKQMMADPSAKHSAGDSSGWKTL